MNKPNVVNLHFIDHCNYSCRYCFVKKESKMLSLENIKIIINNIKRYFEINKINGRINLVGGEVFICTYLQEIIDYINSLNIKVSLVTNGSLLTEEFIILNKEKIETIGISIDSIDEEINKKIGRCNNGNIIEFDKIVKLCRLIKNNEIKLKINLCLSKLNCNDDISEFISLVKPDRFKIFQMTIINGINNKSKNLQLSTNEFLKSVIKYKKFNPKIEKSKEMKNSYLMVDSKGYLYCNKEEIPLGNLLIEECNKLIEFSNIDIKSFNKRYND